MAAGCYRRSGSPRLFNRRSGCLCLRSRFCTDSKPGKLPAQTISETYALEYGSDTLEVHADAICSGERVVVVDDLLATGGTMLATANLMNKIGAEVLGMGFLIELTFLNGREKLNDYSVFSLVQY